MAAEVVHERDPVGIHSAVGEAVLRGEEGGRQVVVPAGDEEAEVAATVDLGAYLEAPCDEPESQLLAASLLEPALDARAVRLDFK